MKRISVDVLLYSLANDVSIFVGIKGRRVSCIFDSVSKDNRKESDGVTDGQKPRIKVRCPIMVQRNVLEDFVSELVVIRL